MICFPNAKINIGLNVVSKRNDGFHNIETVFYPIKISDILEFNKINYLRELPSVGSEYNEKQIKESTFTQTGIELKIEKEKNICYKAYSLLAEFYSLPALNIHLHKIIPFGAGIGGGSADAAFMLKELNNFFNLKLNKIELENYASQIGSDCAFFIKNKPVFAFEKGNKFKDIELSLDGYYILLVKPDIFVSSADAFSGITVKPIENSLIDLIKKPITEWKNYIYNDFETTVFKKYPVLNQIKKELYNQGAVYASMSGSGSSIYGIFKKKPQKTKAFNGYFVWNGAL